MQCEPIVDVYIAPGDRRAALESDVRAGLGASPKSLPPVWFYDDRGSELFDEITRLSEYYVTRAERSILEAHASEIIAAVPADTLVELGSGTSAKTRLLLDAMSATGQLQRFIPFDVSEATLRQAATDISSQYGTEVHAVVGDFHSHLDRIPRTGRRLVAFLGSTIGNLDPGQRRRFLLDLDSGMDHGDHLLLGTDLVKDASRLLAAYDDAGGVTAEFNKNLLKVLNRELNAHFDPDLFEHVAVWDEEGHRIEMRLRATAAHTVTIDDLDMTVSFAEGEDLLTEISSKFTAGQVESELWDSGFVLDKTWTDPAGDFLVALAHPYC